MLATPCVPSIGVKSTLYCNESFLSNTIVLPLKEALVVYTSL